MKCSHKILWVEDGAQYELAYLTGPVYLDDEYDLIIAENISEAIQYLQNEVFQAIILDIRLPPGNDPQWMDLYKKAGSQRAAARLGLHLLRSMLGLGEIDLNLGKYKSCISPEKIGIFTIESSDGLEKTLANLGIRAFQQKDANIPVTALLDMIKQICK